MDPDDVTPAGSVEPAGSTAPVSPGTHGPGAQPADLAVLPPDVARAVTALLSATDVLAGVDPAGLDGAQAAVVGAVAASVVSRLGVVGVRMLPVVEADGLWALGGARSFPRWVAARHRVGMRTAHAQVRLGRVLRDHLPATAAAGAAGDITQEQVEALGRFGPTTDRRREVLADPDHECNEAFLVAQAKVWPVDSLRVVAARWAAAADPEADDRGYREAADREHFTMSRMPDGYHLTGQLTLDHGQTLKTALEAVAPVPAADDERTSAQRRAQALGDLARVVLDGGLVGRRAGVRPHVSVLVPYGVLTAAMAGAEAGAETRAPAGSAADGPGETTSGGELLTAAAVGGESPIGGPQYEDGAPVPRAALDRLMCDAGITRVVFGPDSQVLDVGREERTFSRHLRTAVVARDRHCRYPGCAAPPVLGECHHVAQWSRDHGTTGVTNGILLCWYHHDLIHRRDITIARDGNRWTFTDRFGNVIDTRGPERSTDGRVSGPGGRGRAAPGGGTVATGEDEQPRRRGGPAG